MDLFESKDISVHFDQY